MIPAPFDYHAPASLSEAIALLQQHGDQLRRGLLVGERDLAWIGLHVRDEPLEIVGEAIAREDELRIDGQQPDRLEIEGRGPDIPVMSNATPDGRAKNRRVEVVVSRSEQAAQAQQ